MLTCLPKELQEMIALWTQPDHLYKLRELNKDCRDMFSFCDQSLLFAKTSMEHLAGVSRQSSIPDRTERKPLLNRAFMSLDRLKLSSNYWAYMILSTAPKIPFQMWFNMDPSDHPYLSDLFRAIRGYKRKLCPSIVMSYKASAANSVLPLASEPFNLEASLTILSILNATQELRECEKIVNSRNWVFTFESNALNYAAAAGSCAAIEYLLPKFSEPDHTSALRRAGMAGDTLSIRCIIENSQQLSNTELCSIFNELAAMAPEEFGLCLISHLKDHKVFQVSLRCFVYMLRSRYYRLVQVVLSLRLPNNMKCIEANDWEFITSTAKDGQVELLNNALDMIESKILKGSLEWRRFVQRANHSLYLALTNDKIEAARALVQKVKDINGALVREFFRMEPEKFAEGLSPPKFVVAH